jgi:O-antigen/teichoic acid export membrane protein
MTNGWRDRLRTLAAHPGVDHTVVLQLGQICTVGVQALTSLVLLRMLGPEQVGLYALSVAMVATVALLDITGTSRMVLVEVARASGGTTRGQVEAALARFVRVTAQIRAPIVLVFFLLAPRIAALAYGRADAGEWARWLSLPLVADIPFDMFVLVLQGRSRMRRLVWTETARSFATASVTLAVLFAGWKLPGVVVVQAGASIVAALWAIRAYGTTASTDVDLPPWRDLLECARGVRLAQGFSLGFAMALEKNLSNLGTQLPMLFVGVIRPEAAGYFSAALKTMSLPYPLVTAFARYLDVLLPARAADGASSLRRAFLRTSSLAGGAWVLVTVTMTLLAPVLLIRLAGTAYAPSIPVIYPLALHSLATGAGVGIGAALRGMDKPGYGALLQAMSVVLVAPFGWMLIGQHGAVGAAWFHAIRYVFLTTVGTAMVWRLLASFETTARSTIPGGRFDRLENPQSAGIPGK